MKSRNPKMRDQFGPVVLFPSVFVFFVCLASDVGFWRSYAVFLFLFVVGCLTEYRFGK